MKHVFIVAEIGCNHNGSKELAKRMGKKQSTIANKLRLLKLSDKVRILCLENNLTERHARALLSLPNEELQLSLIHISEPTRP